MPEPLSGPPSGRRISPLSRRMAAELLGPALVSGHLHVLWLYLAAPVAGAVLGVMGCKGVWDGACCAPAEGEGCR